MSWIRCSATRPKGAHFLSISETFWVLVAAALSLLEDLEHPRHPALEVATIGAEGQTQKLGGTFLAGGRVEMGAVQG